MTKSLHCNKFPRTKISMQQVPWRKTQFNDWWKNQCIKFHEDLIQSTCKKFHEQKAACNKSCKNKNSAHEQVPWTKSVPETNSVLRREKSI